MPFYIRARQQDIPTPTISSVGSDDEDNFITDPEKFFDELPQPFRSINKITAEIFEASWEKISALEHARELEEKRIRPPIYKPTSAFDKFANVSCFCQSENEVMFLGLENSVVAYQTNTQNEISTWSPDNGICVEQITCCYHSVGELSLLSIIDDMGFARMLIFENDTFHSISVLNELVEGEPKSNATKLIIAPDAQHCSVSLQSNKNNWIEVYKIPLENWMKEIEAGRKEYLKKTESLIGASASDGSVDLEITQSASSELAFPEVKFSSLVSVLKVNQPLQVTGCVAKTAQQMLDQVNAGEVIGDGTCHGVTENSLNIQKKLFEILNERDLIYAEEISETPTFISTVYFLKRSCMEPHIQSKSDAIFTHIGIWWTNHHNFYIYQLGKSGKNIEFKADAVWPQSANITCCATTNASMTLAIGVETGALSIWDRRFGLVKCVLSVCNNIPLTNISFLNASETSTSNVNDSIYSLVGCANGQISLISSCKKEKPKIVVSVGSSSKFSTIKLLPKLPTVFLMVGEDGNMSLRSTNTDEILCSLELPEDFQFEKPFETGCMIDFNGEVLYIRGSSLSSSDNGKLFRFHLRSFPTLDKSRASIQSEPEPAPVLFKDIVQNILTKRHHGQASRTATLQSRWDNLHKQLDFVLNLKEMMGNKRHLQLSQASSPASHWSKATNNIIAHNKDLRANRF